MTIVKKGNKVLRVDGEGKKLEDRYIAMGYSIIDEDGNVKRSPAGTAEQAVKENKALKRQLEAKNKEIADLHKTIAGLEKTVQEDAEQIAALNMANAAEAAKAKTQKK